MILSDVAVGHGPPPQAVLDKRPQWILLLVLLAVTALLRFATFDLVGGLMDSLMLFLASMMVSNGMSEMMRYALAYTMLSLVGCFFDVMPLLTCIDGRTIRTIEQGNRTHSGNELRIDYTQVIKTTPFFDAEAGPSYNITSLSMVLSPLVMIFGAFLGASAHDEVHRLVLDLGQQAGAFLGNLQASETEDPLTESLGNRRRSGRRNESSSGRRRNEVGSGNPPDFDDRLSFLGRSHRLDDV